MAPIIRGIVMNGPIPTMLLMLSATDCSNQDPGQDGGLRWEPLSHSFSSWL